MPLLSNIVMFRETGSGKSPLIYMFSVYQYVGVSNDTRGCTFAFESQECYVKTAGSPYNTYDTAGFHEATGKIPDSDAILRLYQTITDLEMDVNLLVSACGVRESNILCQNTGSKSTLRKRTSNFGRRY